MNDTAKAYIHGQWRYFVDEREDNGKFTAFMSSTDSVTDGMRTEVATIPDFPTFEEAQNALDGYALKHEFAAECSTTNEEPEMEQRNDSPECGNDTPECGNDTPECGNDTPECGNDTPECGNDMADSENNSTNPDNEGPPSDNDSEESHDEENTKENDVSGKPLSLRDHTFDKILDAADAALNSLIRQLHDKKQHDGELSIKINFADCGAGAIDFDSQIGGKINFVLKATKVCLDENVQIVFDESGNPILPDDRIHQINFDEIQPGQREYPPSGGTAQVDGKTGIVEDYQEDGEPAKIQDEQSEIDESEENNNE